jgi:hypothetical protein
MTLLRRLGAAGVGLFAGITVALLVGDGNFVALGAGVLFAILVFLFTRALTPPAARRDVYVLVALALTLRYAVAVTIHDASLAVGRGGFVTGDDANYADFSWTLVELFRGEPVTFDYGGYLYLLGTFVYLEAAIFAVVGVELLNAALGAGLVVWTCDLGRRLFDDERVSVVAGVVVALFPSLVLWSSLNLKDSLALFLIAAMLWLVVLFNRRPVVWLVLAMYVPLFLMQSLRFYIFVGLAIVIPIGVILASGGHSRARRIVTSGLAVLLSAVLLLVQGTGNDALSASLLARLESERAAMAIGARTGFGRPVVSVNEGSSYVVPALPANPTRPGRTPKVVVVEPNSRIVVGTPIPGSDAVTVLPGDIVVIARRGVTPSPAAQPQPLPISATSGEVQLLDASEDALVLRTLEYLPTGLAFALFAPFPGSGTRAQDLLPIPEMLVWYVLLASAFITLWRWRHRWRVLAPIVLFVGGTVLIFALAEGNVGTLYRHRAMIIPFVAVIGAPTIAAFLGGRFRRAPVPVTSRRPGSTVEDARA